MAIDTCIENFSFAVHQALAESTPKCLPRDTLRPPIPAGLQDEIGREERAAESVADHRGPRSETDFNRLQRSVIRRVNEWRTDQWSATLESLHPEDQSRLMGVPTQSPPW